jgi:predicted ferric reductase
VPVRGEGYPAGVAPLRPDVPPVTQDVPSAPAEAVPAKHHYYHPGVLAFVVAAAVAVAVTAASLLLARSHGAFGYWTVGRVAGFIVYGLLTAAVCLGIFMSLRWRTFGRVWLIAERLHPLLLLTAGALLITHIAAFLLIGLPVYAALVPFTASFRTAPIALGIISGYIGVLLVASTYVIRLIGYGLWRFLHYLGFIAWGAALVHGVETGHDSGAVLAMGYYALGAMLVGALLAVRFVRHIASLRPPILRAMTAGQGQEA